MVKKSKSHSDDMNVRGFYRLQIVDDKAGVIGDSGWHENQVTNLGIRQYLVGWLTSGTGKSVTHAALGTGGAPASDATTLSGENYHQSADATTNSRAGVSTSIVASGTAQFTAGFASSNSFVTASADISNIGLFETYLTSLANAGTLFAGNTYASSTVATNQAVRLNWRPLLVIVTRKFLKLREHLYETIRSEIFNMKRRSETIIETPILYRVMG